MANGTLLIERIVSVGHASPPGFWYDQEWDEWVKVLQGEACLELGDGRTVELAAGEHLLIPRGLRHRVERTSQDPSCLWLAVHWGRG